MSPHSIYRYRIYSGNSVVLLSWYSIVACMRCCRQQRASGVVTIADDCCVLTCADVCPTVLNRQASRNFACELRQCWVWAAGLRASKKMYNGPIIADLHPHSVARSCPVRLTAPPLCYWVILTCVTVWLAWTTGMFHGLASNINTDATLRFLRFLFPSFFVFVCFPRLVLPDGRVFAQILRNAATNFVRWDNGPSTIRVMGKNRAICDASKTGGYRLEGQPGVGLMYVYVSVKI